jgi:hypothetical protein
VDDDQNSRASERSSARKFTSQPSLYSSTHRVDSGIVAISASRQHEDCTRTQKAENRVHRRPLFSSLEELRSSQLAQRTAAHPRGFPLRLPPRIPFSSLLALRASPLTLHLSHLSTRPTPRHVDLAAQWRANPVPCSPALSSFLTTTSQVSSAGRRDTFPCLSSPLLLGLTVLLLLPLLPPLLLLLLG